MESATQDDMPTGATAASQTLSRLRTALIRALRAAPESREPLCDALELVESLQQGMMPDSPLDDSPARPRRQRTAQEYRIEPGPDGGTLAEQRPGQNQPFRCPLAVYTAAADELAKAESPLHFDELLDRTSARLAERQPDYRLRVAIRFWLAHDLVARTRTKYQPLNRDNFPQAARDLWHRTAR